MFGKSSANSLSLSLSLSQELLIDPKWDETVINEKFKLQKQRGVKKKVRSNENL